MLISALVRIVIVPPYCGVPSESHQFPAAVVVVAVVVAVAVVAFVVVVVLVVVVVIVVEEVVVDELHDASSIAATIKKPEHNQINFVFNLFLHFK